MEARVFHVGSGFLCALGVFMQVKVSRGVASFPVTSCAATTYAATSRLCRRSAQTHGGTTRKMHLCCLVFLLFNHFLFGQALPRHHQGERSAEVEKEFKVACSASCTIALSERELVDTRFHSLLFSCFASRFPIFQSTSFRTDASMQIDNNDHQCMWLKKQQENI